MPKDIIVIGGSAGALEEHAALCRRMFSRAQQNGWAAIAGNYVDQAEDAERRADVIRKVLVEGSGRRPRGESGAPPEAGASRRGRTRRTVAKKSPRKPRAARASAS